MTGARQLRRLVPLLLLSAVAGGCGIAHPSELNFRVDKRLHFLHPQNRSTVRPPIKLSWTMTDFTVARQGSAPPSSSSGYFALFVDRAPVRPGQSLKAVASGDPICERQPGCPDSTYLALHQVYTTTHTSFVVPQIQTLNSSSSKVQVHTFIVVLMDTAGRRIGESAWETDLRVPRPDLNG